MSYKIKTTDVFEKQAKRLAKKYASLKKNFYYLFSSLKKILSKVQPSERTVSKSVLRLLQKEKAKVAGEGLLLILW
jgi:mRNA-degrading endonuclease RelE of RelBE toxin-antitoxin system